MWILLSNDGLLKRISVDNYNDGCIEVPDNNEVFLNPSGYNYVDSKFTLGFAIPSNPLLEIEMMSECPVDASIVRKIYWNNELDASGEIFKIWIYVFHFKNGTRITELDKRIWTQADAFTIIDNPMNPGEPVNELEFFRAMIEAGTPLTSVVQYGIQKADLDGTLNRRMEYGQIAD